MSTPIGQEDNFEELFRRDEYLAAVFKHDSRWLESSRRKGLNLSDLRNIPLSVSSGCYAILQKACDKIGFRPKVLSINTSRFTALQWALIDSGVAVVPVEPGKYLNRMYISLKKYWILTRSFTNPSLRSKGDRYPHWR